MSQHFVKIIITSMFVACFNILLFMGPTFAHELTQPTIFIDPQYKLIEGWEGWGTSLAWFSDVLGGLNESVQDEVNTALFSPEKLNLNIVRYTIGATTRGDISCGPFREGAATESFRDAVDSPYLWSRDPRARKILLAAKNLGVDTFEAVSFSPPSWLTRNGCSNGNQEEAPLHDNFDPDNANTFADYLSEVVKYYHENYNITFTTLAPFFRPSAGYSERAAEYCGMERSTIAQVVKSLHASLRAKRLNFCSIAAADEIEKSDIYDTLNFLTDAGVDQLYGKVNVHWYPADKSTKPSEIYTHAIGLGHSLWMAETGFPGTSLQNMTQGLNIAQRVVGDLRTLMPSAWLYWQALESSPGYWGLLGVPYSNATVENINYRSGYYAMAQFSKYIKKGYTIVHVSDWNSVAAYDQSSQTLIIVSVNTEATTVPKTFDLGAFTTVGEIVAFRTSKLEPHVAIPPPEISDYQFSFELLPRSVTTFKIYNAVAKSGDNFIKNWNFESASPNPWYLMYGSRQDNGVNGNYVFQGNRSGFLDFTDSKLSFAKCDHL